MKTKLFRDYQWDAVRYVAKHLTDDVPSVAVVAPTGSGKSVIIAGALTKVKVKGALVGVPMLSIEGGFSENCDLEAPSGSPMPGVPTSNRPVGTTHFIPLREELEHKGYMEAYLSGGNQTEWPVTTHHQLVRWGVDVLPKSLEGYILVLDEAHHAGLGKRDATKLGRFSRAWQQRRGQVLYVTATPYRTDGADVLPEGTSTFTWSIADHAASGYAPENFSLAVIATNVEVDKPLEFSGDVLPAAERTKASYEMMVQQWEKDGKAKSVFIVPAKGSRAWANKLEKALAAKGARVLNAVGTDTKTRDRFNEALISERAVTCYADSQIDVFIACRRFDEGTDWPLCSHVYNWGIPSSFGLILQRWGRAFRDKRRYPDYPQAHAEQARLTFFAPRIRKGAEDAFKRQHHEHAWLLATYLADWETGKEYRSNMRLRYNRKWPRHNQDNPFGGGDDVAGIETKQAFSMSDFVRAQALSLIGKYELLEGEASPSVKEILAWIDTLDERQGIKDAAVQILAERVTEDVGKKARGKLEDLARGVRNTRGSLVRSDLINIFRGIIADYEDQTVQIAQVALGYQTLITGGEAKTVAERLRAQKPNLTEEMVLNAMLLYAQAHYSWPTRSSGNASDFFGFPETWRAVDQALYIGCRGLAGGTRLKNLLEETKKKQQEKLVSTVENKFRVLTRVGKTRRDAMSKGGEDKELLIEKGNVVKQISRFLSERLEVHENNPTYSLWCVLRKDKRAGNVAVSSPISCSDATSSSSRVAIMDAALKMQKAIHEEIGDV